MDKSKEYELRKKVLDASIKYYNECLKPKNTLKFKAGDRVNYAGRIFDENEIINLINASLDFWLTAGKYTDTFEEKLAQVLNIKYCSYTNSGSSANLLAFSALTSLQLGEKRIKPYDEVITVAAGFPTTVTPIIQYGVKPVFIDISIPTYNIDCSYLEEARTDKTKAVMLAHTLGNPFDLKKVKEFCDKYDLWLIEDNCDALGSKYHLNGEWVYTGTVGDIATSSFYPPHHITTGEGGAVYTNNKKLKQIVDSMRDWGRDCSCQSGKDNRCGKRFVNQYGELPHGYDHKYVYSHFGYNLKATDLQAAIGCAQIDKLPMFTKKRKNNWKMLKEALGSLEDYFILPEESLNSDPSWFGFMLTIRDDKRFHRDDIVHYLEDHNIQTRLLFAGNLIKQPCFTKAIEFGFNKFEVVGELRNTDTVMKNSFWIGVYPGICEEKTAYMAKIIKNAIKK